jgi:hypothetical protein
MRGEEFKFIIIIVTQGWVVNGVIRHAEPLGDNNRSQELIPVQI